MVIEKKRPGNIKDVEGNRVYELEKKLEVWKRCIRKLFQEENRPNKMLIASADIITAIEVQYAIKTAKNNKAMLISSKQLANN